MPDVVHLPGSLQLPGRSGWQRVKFGDVVRLNTDRLADPKAAGIERYVGIEHIEPEDLHIRRWGLVADGTTFTNLFRPGQVLFAKRRAYQRKVAVADFEGVCSGDIYVLEPADDRLLPELLPFLCQTEGFFAHALSTSAGSLSPRTNWQQLAQYEFALPPLAEQRRIAALLSEMNGLLETLADAVKSARSLLRAKVSALSQSLDCQPLAVAIETITSGSRGWAKYYSNDGAWFLRAGNLTRDSIEIDLSDLKYVRPPEGAEGLRTRVESEDILLAITGEYLGKVALVRPQVPEAYVNQHLALIRIKKTRFDPCFLAHMLTSVVAQREVWRRNDGGTKPGMTLSEVGALPIPKAPPEDQKIWAESLEQIRNSIGACQVHHERTKTLYRSTLEWLIGGAS